MRALTTQVRVRKFPDSCAWFLLEFMTPGGTRNIKARRERPGCASSALNQRTWECAVWRRSSARSLIATAAAPKTCVFANALESRRRATRFYCCGQVGCQEYSEFSNSTLLISSAPGIGTNRRLRIFRNSEYRKFTYGKGGGPTLPHSLVF